MKKKRFFNAKSFMGMHRVSVKDLLKNASWPMHMTQQGVKNVKKVSQSIGGTQNSVKSRN